MPYWAKVTSVETPFPAPDTVAIKYSELINPSCGSPSSVKYNTTSVLETDIEKFLYGSLHPNNNITDPKRAINNALIFFAIL